MTSELSQDCPDVTTLWRLGREILDSSADGELSSDSDESKLADHIEACSHCQQQLESIAASQRSSLLHVVRGHQDVTAGKDSSQTGSNNLLPRVDGFRLIRELGRGGRSRVFLAEELSTTREVALKVIPIESGDSAPQRELWLSEVRAAARIEHPDVVRLYRVEEAAECFLLVFEYVSGGTLRDWRDEPVSQIQIARFVERVAKTVDQIHQRGILHLDLKPSNILMDTSEGATWESVIPKIADFGISHAQHQAQASMKSGANVRGTPAYMAPEQLLGDASLLSAATDVYGLGGILYSMLTGRPPVTLDDSNRSVDDLVETPIPEPKELDQTIDPDLSRIASRCLRKNPNDRFESAKDLADELHEWLLRHVDTPRTVAMSRARWATAISLATIASFAVVLWPLNRSNETHSKATSDRTTIEPAVSSEESPQTVMELVTRLLENKTAATPSVDEASLVRRLSELPPAFDVERAAQLAVDNQRFTDALLSDPNVSLDRCLQFATLQHASGARFQDGGLSQLYATARYLLSDSVRLLSHVHQTDPDDQAVLEKLIASTIAVALIRVDEKLNTSMIVDQHVRDGLSELRRAVPLICKLTDRKPRIYWAGYLIDSFRIQYWNSRFTQNDVAAELFREWEQEAWAAFAPEQDIPDLAFRHALFQPNMSALTTVDAADQWVLSDDRRMLQREYLYLRLAEVFFHNQTRDSEVAESGSLEQWRATLLMVDQELKSWKIESLTVPMIIHEDLIRPLTTLCTQYRAENELAVAESLQRRYLELSKSADTVYPDDADVHLALSEAYLQAWKNALRRERPDIAVECLRKSLEAAQSAVRFAPKSPRARDQVADRIKRLTRFEAARKPSSDVRD